MDGVRKIDSGSGYPPKFKSGSVPISAMCAFTYILYLYNIPLVPDPGFSQKFKCGSGSEKCSRTPVPCSFLGYMAHTVA